MKRINKQNNLKIHLENDRLIMYGSSSESSGCVLRGSISLKLNKPTQCKTLSLNFLGKISVRWNQMGNGCERKFCDSRIVISHAWNFLPTQLQPHLLNKGTHFFEFELILPGTLPETTHIDKYYDVDYQLKAKVEKRSLLYPKVVAHRLIHLSRQRSNLSNDFFDPILVSDRFAEKALYEFSLPTKIFTYGDVIPVKIKTTPLVDQLQVLFVSCTFKEYLVCRAVHGWFNGKTRSSRRLVDYVRKDAKHETLGDSWCTTLDVQVPKEDIQCDAHNDSVRVWHTMAFHLSLEIDNRVSDIKVILPIVIAITDSIGLLPSYQDAWQSLPYDPLFTPHDDLPS
ncbi:hypothetical protein BY458DRAFT_525366, partial [Sporodiniella umbellata]